MCVFACVYVYRIQSNNRRKVDVCLHVCMYTEFSQIIKERYVCVYIYRIQSNNRNVNLCVCLCVCIYTYTPIYINFCIDRGVSTKRPKINHIFIKV